MAVGVLVHLLSCLVVRYQILLTYLQRKYNGIMLAKLHNFLLFLMQSNLEHITFHCLKVRIIQKVSFEVTCPKNECQFVHKMELFKYTLKVKFIDIFLFMFWRIHIMKDTFWNFLTFIDQLIELLSRIQNTCKGDFTVQFTKTQKSRPKICSSFFSLIILLQTSVCMH